MTKDLSVRAIAIAFAILASSFLAACFYEPELLPHTLGVSYPAFYVDNQTQFDARVTFAYGEAPAYHDTKTVPEAEQGVFQQTFGMDEASQEIDLSKYPDFQVRIEYSNGVETKLTQQEFESKVIRRADGGPWWLILGPEGSATAIPILVVTNASEVDARVTVDYGDSIQSQQLVIASGADGEFTWLFTRENPPIEFTLSQYPVARMSVEYANGTAEQFDRQQFERMIEGSDKRGAWWMLLGP